MSVQSFIFGPGQKYKTQEDLDRARAMVRDIYGNSGSPRTIGEGLSALGDGIMANVMNRRISQGQGEFDKNRASADSSFLSGMSSLSAPAFPSSVAAGGSPTAPAATGMGGVGADVVTNGLIERGFAPHVAQGITMNLQDESGLNPGINEKNPTVSGSRGGFGLAQWTGSRRVALERAANEAGVPVNDRNFQLDFLTNELKGPESRAMASLSAAKTPGEAAAAFVRDFERPAAQHLASRTSKYLGNNPAPVQTASLDPSVGMEQAYAPAPSKAGALAYVNDPNNRVSQQIGQTTEQALARPDAQAAINQIAPQRNNYPEAGKVAPVDWTDQPQYSVAAGMQFANDQQPQGQQVASLPPPQPQTPQAGQDGRLPGVSDAMLRANDQMMGGMFAPQGQQPVQVADNGGYFPPAPDASQPTQQQPRQNGNQLEFYARQMSNPFLSPEMKKLALYQYQQEAERQQKASDPMYQLNLQKGQMEIDALKRGKSALLNAGNGQLYNPNTNEWITAPDSGKEKETTDIQNYNYAKQNNGYTGTLADWVNGVKRGKNSATVNGNTIDLENLPPVSMNEQGTPDPASQAEFLSKLPTSLRAQVQGISEGRIPIEKVTSMRGGERQELARIVSLFDPTFDMSQAGARVAIRKDYASGEMAKLAASSNLALQHAGGMLDAAEKLDNGQYPWVNAAGNYFASKTGQGAQSAFETYRLGVADELGKAFHGVGAVPVETVKEWKNAISTSSSPEQLRAAVDAAVHMLAARTETYNQRYKNVMGQDAPSFLTPESVKTLTKMGIDASVLDPRYVDKSAGKGSQPVNINGYTIKKVQ